MLILFSSTVLASDVTFGLPLTPSGQNLLQVRSAVLTFMIGETPFQMFEKDKAVLDDCIKKIFTIYDTSGKDRCDKFILSSKASVQTASENTDGPVVRRSDLIKWVSGVAALLIAVILIVLFRSRTLQRQINELQHVKKELQKSKNRYRSPSGIFFRRHRDNR